MSYIAELKTKNILIVGGGTTGKSLANYLSNLGANFSVFDEKATTQQGLTATTEISDYSIYDLAIVSPGWRQDHLAIANLQSAGVEVVSEIDFAWNLKTETNPDQIWLAVTGTNGKTTTIQMLESIFIAAGISGIDVLAIELSSFQISWSSLPEYQAVAILNIAQDHIDWHGSFEEYANAKMKLLTQSKTALLNLNDPEIILRSASWTGRKIFFGFDSPQAGEIGLVEELLIDRAFVSSTDAAEVIAELADVKPAVPHNVANAMAAAGLALAIGAAHPKVKSGIANFELDKHRLQTVLSKDGITWVNDSKATNPHAATAALLSHLSNIWIAGGLAKGAKMDDLVRRTASRIKAAIIIGKDGEQIATALERHAPDVKIYRMPKSDSPEELMDQIVSCAKEIAELGDTVLLAPACASMDQFNSYSHRGDLFSQSVSNLVAK
jgi:UDP-N-acetylmuramoylalanine--D-glutamate ligase